MDIKMSLGLPGEALSVPVIRRVLGEALQTLGVDDGCVGDIQVAVSEACTNVLDHTSAVGVYEVAAVINGACCMLRVEDRGRGFNSARVAVREPPLEAEHGRGIQLMRALVDDVSFDSRPDRGTVVYLQKALRWRDNAPPAGLSDGVSSPVGGVAAPASA